MERSHCGAVAELCLLSRFISFGPAGSEPRSSSWQGDSPQGHWQLWALLCSPQTSGRHWWAHPGNERRTWNILCQTEPKADLNILKLHSEFPMTLSTEEFRKHVTSFLFYSPTIFKNSSGIFLPFTWTYSCKMNIFQNKCQKAKNCYLWIELF